MILLLIKKADVGNASLEAYTREKVYFIIGREFGIEGHVFIISNPLYE